MSLNFQARAHSWYMEYRKKSEKTPAYLFAKTMEELGEAFVEWRNGRLTEYTGSKDGVPHPEGLPAELADLSIMVDIMAEEFNIDLAAAKERKMASLEARLDHKRERKAKHAAYARD